MLPFLVTALLMAASDPVPSAAAPAAPPAAVAQAAAKPDAGKKVCWDETPTGSHFTRRVCVTPEELEHARQAAQDAVTDRGRPPPPAFGASR